MFAQIERNEPLYWRNLREGKEELRLASILTSSGNRQQSARRRQRTF